MLPKSESTQVQLFLAKSHLAQHGQDGGGCRSLKESLICFKVVPCIVVHPNSFVKLADHLLTCCYSKVSVNFGSRETTMSSIESGTIHRHCRGLGACFGSAAATLVTSSVDVNEKPAPHSRAYSALLLRRG